MLIKSGNSEEDIYSSHNSVGNFKEPYSKEEVASNSL